MLGQLGDNDGEVILRRSDQDVELNKKNENEEWNGEKWVASKEAEMEGGIVEEAIGECEIGRRAD